MSIGISLIIPVYNTAEYLDKLLSSVSRQTYSDFELLLIDDGSTDDSPRICDEWVARDPRFKVVHQPNAGQSAARNAALDMAAGEYLAFADSDDDVSEDYLKKLWEARDRYRADIVLAGYYEYHGDKQLKLGPTGEGLLDHDRAMEMIVEDEILRSFFWASLFKKELFEGIRLPVGRNYEDLAVIYKLYYRAKTICTITDPVYHYQLRVGSMSYNDATPATWHRKCHFNVESQTERTAFFRKKGERDLAARSLAKSLPYIYSDILTGYQISDEDDIRVTREYLRKEKREIRSNPYISRKDKLLYHIYASNSHVFRLVFGSKIKK